MNKENFNVEEEMNKFVQWVKDRSGQDIVVKRFTQEDFDNMRPAAFDILMEKEDAFFNAILRLEQKHKTLKTVEEIDSLTKSVLKLCK